MQNYQFTPHFPISYILVKSADFFYTENTTDFHNFFSTIVTHELSMISMNFNFTINLQISLTKIIPQ